MQMSTLQTEKFKIFLKKSYFLLIVLLLLYSVYIGVNFKLEGYLPLPWKIEMVGSQTILGDKEKYENLLNYHQKLSQLKKSKLNTKIFWLTTTVNVDNTKKENGTTKMLTNKPTEPSRYIASSSTTTISSTSTTAASSSTTTKLSTSTTTASSSTTTILSTSTAAASSTMSVRSSTTTSVSTTMEVVMYAKSEIKIVGNAPFPRTYLEIYEKNLGPFNRTKDFQDKLFEFLKVTSKLSSGSHINSLSENIQQIDPKKIAPEHQLSMFSGEVIVPFRISYPDKVWKGKQLPLMTATIGGRTGNIMGEYATLYALHRIYNVSVLMHSDMMNALSNDFPNLSIKEVLSDADWKNSSLWNGLGNEGGTFSYGVFELAAAGLFGPKLFNLGGYGFEVQLFHFFYEDIKKEFKFTSKIQNEADEYLRSIHTLSGITNETITYIGFHIRRTDYVNHVQVIFNGTLPGDVYFELAMNYYRKNFLHHFFIVASDDTNFVQESYIGKQKDAHISKNNSALVDMAILSSCNHSIVTMGTYGFWGAYLAGGEVVYPLDTSQKHPYRLNDRLYHQMRLPNFMPIKF